MGAPTSAVKEEAKEVVPKIQEDDRPNVDRGWAWVVLAGVLLGSNLVGFFGIVGIFNVVFLEEFQSSKFSTALINTINVALIQLMAPITGMVVRRTSARVAIVTGSLIATLGCFLSFFAQSITHLIITFGVMIGVGYGLVYPALVIQVAFYFDKYQLLAYGVLNMGVGTGSFIFSLIMEHCLETYGWRGTILIMAGLILNLCVVGCIMRPTETSKPEEKTIVSVLSLSTENVMKTTSADVDDSAKSSGGGSICNPAVYKNKAFMLLCFNLFVISLPFSAVPIHFPASAIQVGTPFEMIPMLVSSYAIASTVSRLMTGVIASHRMVNQLAMYITSNFVAGALLLGAPFILHTFYGQVLFAVLYSLFANTYCTLLAPLGLKYVGLENVEAASGLELLSCGLAFIFGPLAAGFFYDLSGTYNTTYYVGGGLFVFGGFCMALIPLVTRNDEQNATDEELIKVMVITEGAMTSIPDDLSIADDDEDLNREDIKRNAAWA